MRFLDDALGRPLIFRMNSPIDPRAISTWIAATKIFIPDTLTEVWRVLGGGVVFESEEIFEPTHGDESIEAVNSVLSGRGLSRELYVFHRGLCVSAVDQLTRDVVTLDRTSLTAWERFADFDAWYARVLRDEYAARYGLDP